jgi:hypothetical protein
MDILVGMKPTYEELEAIIEKLLIRITDLESQLKKNSKNRSSPLHLIKNRIYPLYKGRRFDLFILEHHVNYSQNANAGFIL